MKKLTLLILSILIFNNIKANSIDDLYNTANNLYKQQQYDSALTIYNSMMQEGIIKADIYFNIGNVYFKKKEYGKAILNYEKAKKLNPSDEDVIFNLEVANTKIIDKIEPLPKPFYKRWWINFADLFTINGWSIISIVFLTLFAFAIAIFLISKNVFLKKVLFYNSFLLLFISIISIFFARYINNELNKNNYAIITPISATIKSSPDDKSTDIFVIHEGLKVEIVDNLENWSEIKLENGEKGWIKNSLFEKI